MKCYRPALLPVLAVVLSLICGCGPKAKAPEKVAARSAPNKQTTPAKAETAKKPAPDPAWVSEIKLQGIGGTSGRRLAIINKKTLGPGDGIQVKAGTKVAILRCIAVRENSVTVSIEGIEGERELHLN